MPGVGDVLSVAGPVLGIAAGAFQYIGAARDEKRAKQERSRLKTPFYKVQNEYFQNRNLAASQAQGGLPEATRDYLTEESSRGLGTAIQGISQSGGSPNNYADLFESYNRSIKQTAAQDAAAQVENISRFMATNKDLAGQKTTQWAINEYQPYQNKLKEITERIKAAKLNKSNAIQTAIGGVTAAGSAVQNSDLMSKIFPKTGQPEDAGGSSIQDIIERQRQSVSLPTTSPSTQRFRPYVSGWQEQQENDRIGASLGNFAV
jgi:hypothetical protein